MFLIANQREQHIFLSNQDSWNFMFIQLFVQELFHFSKKTENFDNFKMSCNF